MNNHYHGLLRESSIDFIQISKDAVYIHGQFDTKGIITLIHPSTSPDVLEMDAKDKWGNNLVEKGKQLKERRMAEKNYAFFLYGEKEIRWFVENYVDNAEEVNSWIKPIEPPTGHQHNPEEGFTTTDTPPEEMVVGE